MIENKYFQLIDWYIQKDDHSRNNANFIYSLPTLNNILSWAISKDFWFDEIYKDYEWVKARDLQEEWWIYFHNMSILWPYCAWFSAKDIATLWLNSNAKNNIATRPPKYYRSLLDQCANFIAVISQEIHWACALNDLTAIVWSYIWYYEEIKWKNLDYQDIVNAYESFIYAVNTPFRAWNSPFTNITMNFDWDEHIKDEYIIIWWNIMKQKYKELDKKYLDISNQAFIDAMKLWDGNWKPFAFPLITVNIYDNFDWENTTFNYLLENMDKWWGCYFENYQTKPFEDEEFKKLNKYIQPRDAWSQRSFCCRFRVSFEDILKASWWSSFRSNAWVWWVWVFNINLNRIAYLSKKEDGTWNKKLFFEKLDFILQAAQSFAQKRRNFIEDHKELYPYFFYYNKSLSTFFNVISIVWWEEAIVNLWYKEWLKDNEWRKIWHKIAEYIVDKINYMMEKDKVPVSLEFAPSESAAPTLAKKDLAFVEWLKNWQKSKIFTEDNFNKYNWKIYVQWDWNDVFLTSWFQPPYNEKNIWAQIRISAEFQSYATWWSVQHMFLWEKMETNMKKNFVKKIFEKPISYITLTPTITVCNDCWEYTVWEHLSCQKCWSKNVMVASRVIWYLKPISSGNLKKENERLDWDENYWQDARRKDWATRKQTVWEDIKQIIED